jgi:NIMA (never in mitosis gene a)-related kinase
VWRDQPYDHKSDIWSLGCVLYEAVTLKPPFRAEDMQGLYKKVLKGVYPKIPGVFSNDLATIIKYMVQVEPSTRPDCDSILDMAIIKKRIQKLFPDDFLYESDSKMNLLSTIRVPKNLLYLTDRLPKPNYDKEDQRRREKEELKKRRTYEGSQLLPDINIEKNRSRESTLDTKTKSRVEKSVDSQGQQRIIKRKVTVQ